VQRGRGVRLVDADGRSVAAPRRGHEHFRAAAAAPRRR
jgi:hypothetical protein